MREAKALLGESALHLSVGPPESWGELDAAADALTARLAARMKAKARPERPLRDEDDAAADAMLRAKATARAYAKGALASAHAAAIATPVVAAEATSDFVSMFPPADESSEAAAPVAATPVTAAVPVAATPDEIDKIDITLSEPADLRKLGATDEIAPVVAAATPPAADAELLLPCSRQAHMAALESNARGLGRRLREDSYAVPYLSVLSAPPKASSLKRWSPNDSAAAPAVAAPVAGASAMATASPTAAPDVAVEVKASTIKRVSPDASATTPAAAAPAAAAPAAAIPVATTPDEIDEIEIALSEPVDLRKLGATDSNAPVVVAATPAAADAELLPCSRQAHLAALERNRRGLGRKLREDSYLSMLSAPPKASSLKRWSPNDSAAAPAAAAPVVAASTIERLSADASAEAPAMVDAELLPCSRQAHLATLERNRRGLGRKLKEDSYLSMLSAPPKTSSLKRWSPNDSAAAPVAAASAMATA